MSCLPNEVQHKIMSHLGLQDFYRYAQTCRHIQEAAIWYPNKNWDLTLYVSFNRVSFRAPSMLRHAQLIRYESREVLFRNAKISHLALTNATIEMYGLKAKTLQLTDAKADVIEVLNRHKPEENYYMVTLQAAQDPRTFPAIDEFSRKFIDRFCIYCHPDAALHDYLTFQHHELTLQRLIPIPTTDYVKSVVEQWLDKKREIGRITIQFPGAVDVDAIVRIEGSSRPTPERIEFRRFDGLLLRMSFIMDRTGIKWLAASMRVHES
ncbi:unnamed protein product, partial [Mesorhabditis spiculigera]